MLRPKISVIIPAYNRIALLENVLTGLLYQTLPRTDYEVIVVDDGSDVPIANLKDKYPFSFISLQMKLGRAAARNKGIEHAVGERVMFLDSDMIPSSNLLKMHLQTSTENINKTVIIGYRYNLMHSENNIAINYHDMIPDSRERFYLHNTDNLRLWPAPWQICYTNNLSVSRKLMEQIGGFDEQFQTWGVEDIELGYRLCKHGTEYKLARNAIAFHQWHPRDQRIEYESYYKNYKIFLNKHRTFDIELFFAKSPESGERHIRGDMLQKIIATVLIVCERYQETWRMAPDLPNVTCPCAVLCGGNQSQSGDGWYIFHPSLQTRSDPISLLGIELPYPSRSFSSALLTSAALQLPQLLPVMIQEAFRLAPVIWLELPISKHFDLTTLPQISNSMLHLPIDGGRLCLLKPDI